MALLSEEESYALWKRYAEEMEILVAAGVFDIKNGSATLHFDSLGRVAAVEANLKLFKREKLSTVIVAKMP